MKSTSGITSVESKAIFHEEAFEDFINSAMPCKESSEQIKARSFFSPDYEKIDWCGAYVPFNGTVDILAASKDKHGIKRISIPVTSVFLVVCTKGQDEGKYRITWSTSLS